MKRIGTKMVDIGKEYRLGFVLIAGEDVLLYFTKPVNKRHFSDLVANIGLDTGNHIIADVVAGALIGFLAPIEGVVLVAAGVAFVGLAIAGVMNWALDSIEEELGIKKDVQSMAAKCGKFLDDFWH